MPAKDLGTKHICFKCGTKFYDLKKAEPICPKCGADQRQNPATKTPERRQKAPPKPAPEPVEKEVDEEVDEAELDGELDEESDEDADEGDDA